MKRLAYTDSVKQHTGNIWVFPAGVHTSIIRLKCFRVFRLLEIGLRIVLSISYCQGTKYGVNAGNLFLGQEFLIHFECFSTKLWFSWPV